MTKGEYFNKLHDSFNCHPRRLKAFVKSGVVNWPFGTNKVKPVSFKECLLPFDACGIAKTTSAIFQSKIMTDLTIGSVWQTDICGKWAIPSLQGNTYIIGFFEMVSKKIFLYFSKSKNVLN